MSCGNNLIRKRGARTSHEQYELLLTYAEKYKCILNSKIPPCEVENYNRIWKELVVELNAVNGPQKTLEQWKKTFTEWKCKVKGRARNVKNEKTRTGGGEKNIKDLTDLEMRLMGLLGWVTVEGDPDLEEGGLQQQIQQKDNLQVENNKNMDADLQEEDSINPTDNIMECENINELEDVITYHFQGRLNQPTMIADATVEHNHVSGGPKTKKKINNFKRSTKTAKQFCKSRESVLQHVVKIQNEYTTRFSESLERAYNCLADSNNKIAAAREKQAEAVLELARSNFALAEAKRLQVLKYSSVQLLDSNEANTVDVPK